MSSVVSPSGQPHQTRRDRRALSRRRTLGARLGALVRSRAVKVGAASAAIAAVLASGLVVAGVGIQAATAASPSPTVAVGTSQTVLAGEDVTLELTFGANPAAADQYNLSASVLLPATVTFQDGDVTPSKTYAAGTAIPGGYTATDQTCAAVGLERVDTKCVVPAGAQYLVFENISDLPERASKPITLTLRPDADVFHTGTELPVVVSAFTSDNERYLPVFPGSTAKSADAAAATSDRGGAEIAVPISAVRITKAAIDGVVEGKMLRGVHEQTGVFQLTVHHTGEETVTDAVVVDYLHAGLEFLGCGDDDFTTDANGTRGEQSEYPGAPNLGGQPLTDCVQPLSVETIQATQAEATAYGLVAGAVYTKVTWELEDLTGGTAQVYAGTAGTPGATKLTYRVGIPLFENTMDFGDTTPTPESLEQGSNLDNNRGASTAHGVGVDAENAGSPSAQDARRLTNTGVVHGATERGGDTTAHDTAVVEAEDVRIVKTVTTKPAPGEADFGKSATFETGQIATYRLRIDTSEYAGAVLGDRATTRLVDDLGNGICPAIPAGAAVTPGVTPTGLPLLWSGDPRDGTDGATALSVADWNDMLADAGVDAACGYPDPTAQPGARLEGATLSGIAYNPTTGRFFIRMELAPTDAVALVNSSHDVIYTVVQNADYRVADGKDGATSSGDVVDNRAEIVARTSTRPELAGVTSAGGAVAAGDRLAQDQSVASLETSGSRITKQVLPRSVPTPTAADVAAATGWVDSTTAPFAAGDTVWFKISFETPADVDVRNPKLTDFLPTGLTYEGGTGDLVVVPRTFQQGAIGTACAAVTTPAGFLATYVSAPVADAGGGALRWELGKKCFTDSNDRFIPQNTKLDFYLKTTVTDVADSGTVDITDNLAKYQQENVDGEVSFMRAAATIALDGGVALSKGIESITRAAEGTTALAGAFGQRQQSAEVVQNDIVTYVIDVTAPVVNTREYVIWDMLPDGITSKDVVAGSVTVLAHPSGESLSSVSLFADPPHVGPVLPTTDYADRTILQVKAAISPDVVLGSSRADGPTPAVARGFTISYQVKVPAGTVTGGGGAAQLTQEYRNTAGVVSYDVVNDTSRSTTVVPQRNGTDNGQQLTNRRPAAGEMPASDENTVDSAVVSIPGATPAKRLVNTEIGSPSPDTNGTIGLQDRDLDNAPGQIVQGELATFQYAITIPAHTTVKDAKLIDDGLFTRAGAPQNVPYEFVGAAWDAAGVPGDFDPSTFTLHTTTGAEKPGTLVFPSTYTNSTNIDQVFTVTLRAWVADTDAGNPDAVNLAHGTVLTNTARFTHADPNDAANPVMTTATATATYIEPDVTITKTADRATEVAIDTDIVYSITVENTTGRPTSFDNVIVDTLPAGLVPQDDTYTVQVGAQGQRQLDDTEYTYTAAVGAQPATITWSSTLLAELRELAGGARVTFGYTARIDPGAAAGGSYTNAATITGYTLPAQLAPPGDPASSDRRGVRSATDDQTVTTVTAAIDKGVRVGAAGAYAENVSAPIGQTVSYQVRVTLNAFINYYGAEIVDTLPAGVRLVAGTTPGVTLESGAALPGSWNWTQDGQTWTGAYSAGTIAADPSDRVLVITYQAVLADDPDGVRLSELENTASFTWLPSVGADPDDRTSVQDAATVEVLDPVLSIAKALTVGGVAATTANPGDTLSYTVRATNTGATPAYALTVVDAVPVGIIADEASVIASGGTLSTDKRTITWNVAGPISNTAGSNTVSFTYTATFAASTTLGTAALVNTASVTSFSSFDTDGRVTTPTDVRATASVAPKFPLINTIKARTSAEIGYLGTATVPNASSFEITLTNGGTGIAKQLSAVDTLPAGWAYVPGSTTRTLPGGTATAFADPSGTGTLTWADLLPAGTTLAPGASVKLTYQAFATTAVLPNVGLDDAFKQTNTAKAAAVSDPTGAVRNATGENSYIGTSGTAFVRIAQADLAVTKTLTPDVVDNFVAGGTGSWTVTVRNRGADPAIGVKVADRISGLPTGATVSTPTGTGWTCQAATGGYDCTLTGELAVNATASFVVVVSLPSTVDPATEITNVATVSAQTYDDDLDNNVATSVGTVTAKADLQVTKTASQSSVVAGQGIDWSVRLTNAGPSLARVDATHPIVITDELPATVDGTTATVTSVTGADEGACAIADGVLTCTITSALGVGESVVVGLRATVLASTQEGAARIVNTAAVSGGITPDPTPANNAGTSRTDVTEADNPALNKVITSPAAVDGSVAVVPGQSLRYEVTVTNPVITGPPAITPSDSRAIVVSDTLPLGMSLDTSTVTAGWTPTAQPASAGREVWQFAYVGTGTGATLASGSSLTLGYTADIAADAAGTGTPESFVNSATVKTHAHPAWVGPKEAPAGVQRYADLGIVKTVSAGSPTTIVPGGTGTVFTLTVTNAGPSDAASVVVSDTLPTGLVLDLAVGRQITSDWTPATGDACDATGASILCSRPVLAAGATWTITIPVKATPDALGTLAEDDSRVIVNTATVRSSTPEPTDATLPNSGSAAVTLDPQANLTFEKVASPRTVRAGEDTVWTVTVTNTGRSDAHGVEISDPIPDGLVLDEDALSDDCSFADGTVTCTYPSIPFGESRSFEITTRVPSNVPDGTTFTNIATVEMDTPWDGTPPDPATDTITVVAVSGLTIDKTVTLPTAVGDALPVVAAGDAVTYTVQVRNPDGPSDAAANVVVTDELPDGFTLTSATALTDASGYTWRFAQTAVGPNGGDLVVATLYKDDAVATLPVGYTPPAITMVVRVATTHDAGDVRNSASVASPSDVGGDDDADVNVITRADLGIVKSHGERTAVAGTQFTWDVVVTNHGPSVSRADDQSPIVVRDELPSGVTFAADDDQPADTICAAEDLARTIVVCTISEDLPVGTADAVSMQIVVDLDQTLSTTVEEPLANTATVTPGVTPEPEDPTNPNSSRDELQVVERADLGIVKTAVDADGDEITRVVAGEDVRWRIVVTNHGPSDSNIDDEHLIVVSDTLPAGVTVTDLTVDDDSGWSCTPAEDGTSFSCSLTRDLLVGDAPPILVTASVAPAYTDGGALPNTATVVPGLTTDQGDDENEDSSLSTVTVDRLVDLGITKNVRDDLVAGATGVYRISVTNAGPSDASGVVITDDLPQDVTFDQLMTDDEIALDADAVTCVPNEGRTTVVCTLTADLAAGATVHLDLRVDVASRLITIPPDEIVNHAEVSTTTTEKTGEDALPNEVDLPGTVTTMADLQIRKSHSETARAVAGTPFTWTVTVTNDGPSDSRATAETPIRVTDVLPLGVTLSESVPSGDDDVSCLAAGVDEDGHALVSCEITETIVAGATVTLTINTNLDQRLAGEITNVVRIEPGHLTDLPDVGGDRTWSDPVLVQEEADLSVVKRAVGVDPITVEPDAEDRLPSDVGEEDEQSAPRAIAGKPFTWEVEVTNHGPSDSNAADGSPIRIVDTLPAGVAFIESPTAGWVCTQIESSEDGRVRVECAYAADLLVGESVSVRITGRLGTAIAQDDVLVNDVTVFPGTTVDPNGQNDSTDVSVGVDAVADLAITKTIAQSFTAGERGVYRIDVVNVGPSDAQDVVVTDELPVGLSFQPAASSTEGAACSLVGTDVVCALDEPLAAGASFRLELSVLAASSLTEDIVNTAHVVSSTTDPVLENNTDAVPGAVAAAADLSIVKRAVGQPVVGGELVYELAVHNAGPSDARGVVIADTVPETLTVLAVDGAGLDCATGQQVTCLVPTFAAGADVLVRITVRVDAAAYPSVVNTATVTSTTVETDPSDNTSTVETDIPALSTLTITKALEGTLTAGQRATYLVTVGNDGPTEDPGPITVTDELPAGLSIVSVRSGDRSADCTSQPGAAGTTAVTCLVQRLDVGEQVQLRVEVQVSAGAQGELTNVATVSSDAMSNDTPPRATATATVIVHGHPVTGLDAAIWIMVAIGALLLLLVGGVLLLRRRRREDVSAED